MHVIVSDLHLVIVWSLSSLFLLQHRQHESVRGVSPCIIDNSPVVLSGGTDRFVRLWNLVDPAQCSCVIKPKQYSKTVMLDYE